MDVQKFILWTSEKLWITPKASRGEEFESDFVRPSQEPEKAVIGTSADTLIL